MMRDMIGAVIQRGTILSVTGQGVTVQSLETGIVTQPLGTAAGIDLQVGTRVLYCEFSDGEGYILRTAP